MKFQVKIVPEKGKIHTIRGFLTVADAVECAYVMATRRRDGQIWIECLGGTNEHLCGWCCADQGPALPLKLARAESQLAKIKVARKGLKERREFIKTHGGYCITDRILGNDAARTAFFSNDFAPVEKFLAETMEPAKGNAT